MLTLSDTEPLYELGQLEGAGLNDIEKSFDRLPPDPYAEERLRSRRFSRFKLRENGTLEHRRHKEFMQTKEVNSYAGDIKREYEEIEDDIITHPLFIKMFQTLTDHTDIGYDRIIEAHQIRWHCQKNIKAPAPEGVHQDGFDFLGMFMITPYNVDGGEVMLYKSPDSAPCFKKAMEAGEFIIVNDRSLYHNASPLVPTANEEDGHWDFIVLTT